MNEYKSVKSIIESSGISFGTSGARGLVEEFSDEVCAAFSIAFIATMEKHFSFNSIAIGIDRRPSSPQMAAACAGAAYSMGYNVEYFGVLPTPALALESLKKGIPAIMVTGSHIPFDRNGIKFYKPDGEIKKSDELNILTSEAHVGDFTPQLPLVSDSANDGYISRYVSMFPEGFLKGWRIGLYEHSAAGRDLSTKILRGFGAEVISLGRTDDFIPIDTEAVSKIDQEKGRKWAAEHTLDALFSTDGDGDRPLVANEHGEWLRGDVLGLLCAKYQSIDALAIPVSCNTAIEKSGSFQKVLRTKIGSPYVIEGMEALDKMYVKTAGFEANGGFLTRDLPTRDALLPALSVFSMAIAKGVPLSEIVANLPNRYTASDRIQNAESIKLSNYMSEWFADSSAMFEETGMKNIGFIENVDYTDGVRMTFDQGDIVHLRPSGNAPELRCYAESSSLDKAEKLVELFLNRASVFCC